MKNASLKKILTTAIGIMLVLSMIFVISSCKKEHEHTLEESVLVAATCEEGGKIQIACTDPECGYVEEKDVASLGHDYEITNVVAATCNDSGKVTSRCLNCYKTVEKVVASQGHSIKTVAAKAATCTTQGYPEHKVCTECSWTTLNSSDIIAPLGHISSEWKDDRQNSINEYSILYPTCTEAGYHYNYIECTRTYKDSKGSTKTCGHNLEYVKVEDAALGHDISEYAARAAGCCIGWDGFDYCNGWTRAELSAKGYPHMPAIRKGGNDPRSEGCGYNTYVELAAVYDHKMSGVKYVEVVPANCDEDGIYAWVKECTTCAIESEWPAWSEPDWDQLSDKPDWYKGTQGLDNQKFDLVVYTEFVEIEDGVTKGVIDALGHEWQTHKAQAETCTVDGWEAYTMCTRCSGIDTDLDGTPDTTKVPVIPACHVYEADGCYNICVREVVYADGAVGRCGNISSENPYHHNVITLTGKQYDEMMGESTNESADPTCVDAGFYTCIKYCVDCDKVLSRELVRIDPLGHDYVEHIAKAPTCTTIGWEAFKTCSRCSYTDFVQIDALDHKTITDETDPTFADYHKENVVTAATCLYGGKVRHVYYCTVCGEAAEVKVVDTPMLTCEEANTLVKVEVKPATCTNDGHNAYEYCTFCTYTTKVVEEKLGHDIEIVAAQAPTCTAQGWNAYGVCKRDNCGYDNKAEMMIKALGHDMVDVAIQNPTCTEVGYVAHKDCSRCEYTEGKEEIPATNHAPLAAVIESGVAATCLKGGNNYEVVYCGNANCGAELSRVSVPTAALGHTYSDANGYCVNGCGDRISIGLAYSNNADGTTCVVSGLGTCTDTEIIIPNEINGRKVVGIAYRAFYQEKITSVVIGKNVTEIGIEAFYMCTALKSVTIGSGVTTIQSSAFSMCKALNTVKYVGTAAMWSKISITSAGNSYFTSITPTYI